MSPPQKDQQKEAKKKVSEKKSLNTKQITKCTVRFYDPEFSEQLEKLYNKVGGSQTAFFNMLIREGFKNIEPLFEKDGVPAWDSLKESVGEGVIKSVDEVKASLLEASDTELKELKELADNVDDLAKMLACIYNIYALGLDDELKDIIEHGGLDRIPKRFQKGSKAIAR